MRQSAAAVVRKGATGTLFGRQPVRMRSRAAMALYLCFLKRCTCPQLQPSRGLGKQKIPSPPKSVCFVRLFCTASPSIHRGTQLDLLGTDQPLPAVACVVWHHLASQSLQVWSFSILRVAYPIARDMTPLGAQLKRGNHERVALTQPSLPNSDQLRCATMLARAGVGPPPLVSQSPAQSMALCRT